MQGHYPGFLPSIRAAPTDLEHVIREMCAEDELVIIGSRLLVPGELNVQIPIL